jgi:nitroreductase
MELNKAIKSRHSCRSFKEKKKPSWEDVVLAIDAANYAPLAGNISTLRYIVVEDEANIKKLANACQQRFIQDVRYLVVVCSDNSQIKKVYGERADKYSKQQAGAAIQNFLLEIENLGLASCWVGAFEDSEVRFILGISDDIEIEAILPIGYEMGSYKKRKLPNLDNYLFFDKWKMRFKGGKYDTEVE